MTKDLFPTLVQDDRRAFRLQVRYVDLDGNPVDMSTHTFTVHVVDFNDKEAPATINTTNPLHMSVSYDSDLGVNLVDILDEGTALLTTIPRRDSVFYLRNDTANIMVFYRPFPVIRRP